jgi:hypothetical protein
VKASDLRGGAALVIAGLAAEGITGGLDVEMMNRGYERFEDMISQLGGEIVRVENDGGIDAKTVRRSGLPASGGRGLVVSRRSVFVIRDVEVACDGDVDARA